MLLAGLLWRFPLPCPLPRPPSNPLTAYPSTPPPPHQSDCGAYPAPLQLQQGGPLKRGARVGGTANPLAALARPPGSSVGVLHRLAAPGAPGMAYAQGARFARCLRPPALQAARPPGSRALRGAVKPQTRPPTGWPGSGLAASVFVCLFVIPLPPRRPRIPPAVHRSPRLLPPPAIFR